ncbi:pentatricopeptide repeat-containing protein At1g05750, chloroplastic-like [Silene latifolia]|uniref:pentatricopeptide repeat-containing protein At1g05750, chloroplastic-like n=1 Tax=Silene latifolia TaxID=37657 RepID=UPI003D7846E3
MLTLVQIPSTFPPKLTTSNRLPVTTGKKPANISLNQPQKPVDPVVPWTSAIARHCQKGNLSEAIKEFTRMRMAGIDPNHITLITLLSGCAHFPAKAGFIGPSIHGYVKKLGFDRGNVKMGTVIVDMYSKCGLVELARVCFDEILVKNSVSWNTMIDGYMRNGRVDNALKLFDEMPVRDVISWTVLICGFLNKGLDEKALECFSEMQLSGVNPDYVTVIAVLSASANLGALSLGLWVNKFVMGKQFRENIRVCNTLIDMYSRCGRVDLACEIFEKMVSRSLVSWNSIIGGFATNGYVGEALEYFDRMKSDGFMPDGVTFTGVFTACSHAGLVSQGLEYFHEMELVHNIFPRIEHYGCLVDLHSRAGRLEDALNVVKNMPMKPNEVVLGSLLSACRNFGDISLAETVMKYLVDLDPRIDSNYVMLANIYAEAKSWEGSSKVRRKMKSHGIQKRPGISSIEIEGGIHEFVATDKSHSETDSIYGILDILSYDLGICGYVEEAMIPEL